MHAAILLVAFGGWEWVGGWVAWELIGKVAIGVGCGWIVGMLLARLAFRAPARSLRFAETAEAIVALSAVFVSYGLAEAVGGYGFLAVFCTAIALRAFERGHEYHRVLHEFVGQLERLLTLALLLVFGYALMRGILGGLTWSAVLWGLCAVLLVRPVTAWLSLRRLDNNRFNPDPARNDGNHRITPSYNDYRRSIAFFGVRGIGSFYYLAFALNTARFPEADVLWATVSFVVLASVVIHGVSAAPVLRALDRRFGRRTPDPA